MFLFYLEIVNKMRQVSIKISEFIHSIKQPDRRCNNKFIWQFTALIFQIFLIEIKMWKTLVKACKLLKSLSKRLEAAQKKFY